MPNRHHMRIALVIASLGAAVVTRSAFADPAIHLELRLAPGQDSVLTLGNAADDTLVIELWAEITDAEPGTVFKSFLVPIRSSQTGVISYNGDFISDAFSLGCVFNAPDNTPSTGDLTPSCLAPGFGVSDGVDAPAMIGSFSVTAQALGATTYGYAPDDGNGQPWGAFITDGGLPAFVELTDSNCGDGSCNVTGSVEAALAVIEVIDVPQIPRSADADDDGDVDLIDYARMTWCAALGQGNLSDSCKRVDLTYDDVVDGSDMMAFTSEMTGILPPFGDADGDYDIDLADYARYQVCNGPDGITGIEAYCALADTNRDGVHDEADLAKLVERLAGPNAN